MNYVLGAVSTNRRLRLIRGYLPLSPRSEWIMTTHASHFIHTDEPELVLSIAQRLLTEIK
jgi:pimeloyl-ACP methyl ester carboxylesterase